MTSAAAAAAWLLEYHPGKYAAFPATRALALAERPHVSTVPGAPAHCLGLMFWEGRYVPLLDLACMACPADRAAKAMPPPAYALVLAWHGPGGWQPGALSAPFMATMSQVSDPQQCASLPDLLPHLACSWFSFEGQPTPVIDVDRLFCGSH